MANDISERINSIVSGNDVVLFMKGEPAAPLCGFSAAVVQILNKVGVKYGSVNVMVDGALREGIKSYSNWPTIPQLYIKGEFIGGCDIVREMFQSGELKTLLEARSITATPAAH